jgi:hypothetical protein
MPRRAFSDQRFQMIKFSLDTDWKIEGVRRAFIYAVENKFWLAEPLFMRLSNKKN